ncbi:hypothetical protein DPSP01_001509 [Paraphaeosphaeria sporulosa]
MPSSPESRSSTTRIKTTNDVCTTCANDLEPVHAGVVPELPNSTAPRTSDGDHYAEDEAIKATSSERPDVDLVGNSLTLRRKVRGPFKDISRNCGSICYIRESRRVFQWLTLSVEPATWKHLIPEIRCLHCLV